MFIVYRLPSGACQIRFAFHGSIEDTPPSERRAFIRLASSIDMINTWLLGLAADTKYSLGTGYEYAKVLCTALEWLALEPVCLYTRKQIGQSLLTLQRDEARALIAWLTIPAREAKVRARLAKTGQLPPQYRKQALSPATHNLRLSALTAFYNWLLTEYVDGDISVSISANPFTRLERPRFLLDQSRRLGPTLLTTRPHRNSYTQPLRWQEEQTVPVALTAAEFERVLAVIPHVSLGRNGANRNGALVRLLLWGMLRESEAVGTTWEALDDVTLFVYGKGGKSRAIPIPDTSTWSYLHAYTNEMRIPLEQRFRGPLFRQLDHEDRPITKHSVEHLILTLRAHFGEVADGLARSGDPHTSGAIRHLSSKLHSHVFRVTGATFMAAAGMNLFTLSKLLGHADPLTTLRYYIDVDQVMLTEKVREVYSKISATLEQTSHSEPRHLGVDPLQWYRRRGLLPTQKG